MTAKKIEFFMPMQPPTMTHQQKKARCVNGKPVFYEDAELKAVRQKLMGHLGCHTPEMRLGGPVRLKTRWCFPRSGKHAHGDYKATKPDTDNLQKLLKDCMTDVGFWNDDAQVASELIEKFWSDVPGIHITIEELAI